MNIAQFVYHSIFDDISVASSLWLFRILLLCTFLSMSVGLVSSNGISGSNNFLKQWYQFSCPPQIILGIPSYLSINLSIHLFIYTTQLVKQSFWVGLFIIYYQGWVLSLSKAFYTSLRIIIIILLSPKNMARVPTSPHTCIHTHTV